DQPLGLPDAAVVVVPDLCDDEDGVSRPDRSAADLHGGHASPLLTRARADRSPASAAGARYAARTRRADAARARPAAADPRSRSGAGAARRHGPPTRGTRAAAGT